MTPWGIEPAAFRLEAQCLSQLRYSYFVCWLCSGIIFHSKQIKAVAVRYEQLASTHLCTDDTRLAEYHIFVPEIPEQTEFC